MDVQLRLYGFSKRKRVAFLSVVIAVGMIHCFSS